MKVASKADTHLNMCAVKSQLKKHEEAMSHAQQAIIIVQSTLLMNHLPIPSKLKEKEQEKGKSDDPATKELENSKEFKDRVSVLTIAYHNLAVEQEFLNMYEEA